MQKEIKVLVIDDELIIRNSFRRFLEPRGYRVNVAANAHEGLDNAKKEHFDIAFVDIVMPEMDGVSAIERLREVCPELKIVIITGYADEEHVKRALDSGLKVFASLRKPFDIAAVDDIIKRATQ